MGSRILTRVLQSIVVVLVAVGLLIVGHLAFGPGRA